MRHSPVSVFLLVLSSSHLAAADAFEFDDPDPKRYHLTARASELDPRAKEHPEIGFVFGTKEKPVDIQNAVVDTSVAPRGKLVIWLMSYKPELFDYLAAEGFHVIQPHYANKWFSLVCRENPVGPHCRGNVRLEAATGEDFSEDVDIPRPDGMMERAYRFVRHLQKVNPEGKWEQFLGEDGRGLRWADVIVSGSSHGSTTSARFAKHVKVSRVVCFAGPRDQHQQWQALPSKTPPKRFFGFTHVLDSGWTGDHYCRSWELLGMHEFGPIVNVEKAKPPFGNTRRLVTDFDVGGDAKRAHGAVTPGKNARKNKDGSFAHEVVWRFLYTHPVNRTGDPVPMDDGCLKDHPQ